jgi:hypothetical protein
MTMMVELRRDPYHAATGYCEEEEDRKINVRRA